MKKNVILLKSDGCPFCYKFEPVYERTSEKIKDRYVFHEYDVHNPKDIKLLKNNYSIDVKKIEGVPTVFAIDEKKNNYRINTVFTDDFKKADDSENSVNERELLKKATKKFIKNIDNGFDNLKNKINKTYETKIGGNEDYSYKIKKYLHKCKLENIDIDDKKLNKFKTDEKKYNYLKTLYLNNTNF